MKTLANVLANANEIFSSINEEGDGFSVGSEDQHVNELEGLGRLALASTNDSEVAVYVLESTATIVGDANGPWAVEVEVEEEEEDVKALFGDGGPSTSITDVHYEDEHQILGLDKEGNPLKYLKINEVDVKFREEEVIDVDGGYFFVEGGELYDERSYARAIQNGWGGEGFRLRLTQSHFAADHRPTQDIYQALSTFDGAASFKELLAHIEGGGGVVRLYHEEEDAFAESSQNRYMDALSQEGNTPGDVASEMASEETPLVGEWLLEPRA